MKKIYLVLMCISLIFLSGCDADKVKKDGFTFTDDLGREVTVNSPKRVATLLGSFSEVWMLSGGTICAAADDTWEDYDNLDIPKDAINLGNTENLSFESLIEANPDFVIASARRGQQVAWEEPLLKMGIPVAYFDVSDFNEYLNMLEICTKITGRDDLYLKNGKEVEKVIKRVIDEAELRDYKPKVLFLRASAGYIRAKNSKKTVLGEMLYNLGCINIADSEESLLENISLEIIIKENPEHIFIVQSGDNTEGTRNAVKKMFDSNPAWKSVSAYKNNNIHFMDKKLYNFKPNARWGEAYEKLEKLLVN